MAKHLTLEERDRIAHLNSRGFAQAAIAKALGRSPSVISRELRRNRAEDGTYYGGVAQDENKKEGHAEMFVVIRYRDRDANRIVKTDYYLSDASADTSLSELCRVAKAEHRIEECIQRGKSEVGLGDYEVRNWCGWHHHQILSLIACLFLIVEAQRGKKITPAITVQQIRKGVSQILHRASECDTHSRIRREREQRLKRNELARLYHWKQHKLLPSGGLERRQI